MPTSTKTATHLGSPFVGRGRETGLLLRLLDDGLCGSLRLVCVSGVPGIGRRRLIDHALREGPDAEWIHLAPGDVEPDPVEWVRTEFLDVLDAYPDAPIPSWAIHALCRFEPSLGRLAPVKPASRERFSDSSWPDVLGSAIGASLKALSGQTSVIVDAGLLPPAETPERRTIDALSQALAGPGAIVVAASEGPFPEGPNVRTLEIGPLRFRDVQDLVGSWSGNGNHAWAGAWLHRITGGHPFFLHEAVRWLEESGHVRVDDERLRVEFLDDDGNLPLPLNLESVLDARYRRLSRDAARLLQVIARNDGRLRPDALQLLHGSEDAAFFESLTALRRRGFLRRRSLRRHIALASPAWRDFVLCKDPATPRRARVKLPDGERRSPAVSPLAHALGDIEEARTHPASAEAGIARTFRLSRDRSGFAWDGVRGRLALLAAGARPARAALWVRWGLSRLSPEAHPALRRALMKTETDRLEQEGRAREANDLREAALREALASGHLVSAARIRAASAEGLRRLGALSHALSEARSAEADLHQMGRFAEATLATYTLLRSLVDARRVEEAEEELHRRNGANPYAAEIALRIESLRGTPPIPVPPPGLEHPRGWGWGLDASPSWGPAREGLSVAVAALAAGSTERLLPRVEQELEQAGQLTELADLQELRVWASVGAADTEDLEERLEQVASLHRRLGAPERGRHFALALSDSRATGLPAYRRAFFPLLLRTARDKGPVPELPRLHLTGRARVERGGDGWPLALWPEWQRRLVAAVVSSEILETPFTRDETMRCLRDSGDAPPSGVEEAIETTNHLLAASRALELRGEHVRFAGGGIRCDALQLIAALRGSDNGMLRDALDLVGGVYLPGIEDPLVLRARVAFAERVREALGTYAESGGPLDVARAVRWADGVERNTTWR